MSISNILATGGETSTDKTIYCHKVICDAASDFQAGLTASSVGVSGNANVAGSITGGELVISGPTSLDGGLGTTDITCATIDATTASATTATITTLNVTTVNNAQETFVSGGGAMQSYAASNVNGGHAFAYAILGTEKNWIKLTGCYTFTPNNPSGNIRINCGASFNSSIANGDSIAVGIMKNTVSGAETPFNIKRYDAANRIIIDFTGLTSGNAYRLTFNAIVPK